MKKNILNKKEKEQKIDYGKKGILSKKEKEK